MIHKKFISLISLILSINLTANCSDHHGNASTLFFTVNSPSEYIVKSNQFHIVGSENIALKCLAAFPIKIIFTGIMLNRITENTMRWNKGKNMYEASISFKNTPEATGPYSCVNAETDKKKSVNSTLYIYADFHGRDLKNNLFLLSMKPKGNSTLLTVPISEKMVLIPCITFRPGIRSNLFYNKVPAPEKGKWKLMDPGEYEFDDTKGLFVNVTKCSCSRFKCSLQTEETGIEFMNPEMNYNVYPGVTKDNGVIQWGYLKEDHKPAQSVESTIRNDAYYKFFVQIDTDTLNRTSIDKIVCKKKKDDTAFKRWFIFHGKSGDRELIQKLPVASVTFDRKKKMFHCGDSKGGKWKTNMAIINCDNIADCESVRRFTPWEMESSKASEGCTKCTDLKLPESTRPGIVYCQKSDPMISIDSLQYFFDLNDQIVEEMNYKKLDDVLKIQMSKYKNTTSEIYWEQSFDFICEASSLIFVEGLKVDFYINSTRVEDCPKNPSTPNIRYSNTIAHKKPLCISNEIGAEVKVQAQCSALKWNTKIWETVTTTITVKGAQEPRIVSDGHLDNNDFKVNITFHHFRHDDLMKNNITCKATGIPLPNITWMANDTVTENKRQYSNSTKYAMSTVTFSDVKTLKEAHCSYVCIAENVAGKTNKTFNIAFTNKMHDSQKEADQRIYYSIGAFSLVVLILLGAIFVLWRTLNLQKVQIERLSEAEIQQFINGDEDLVTKYQELHEIAQYLPYKQQFEIHQSKIEIKNDNVLGSGNYGMVVKGILQKSGMKYPVALKTVKSGTDIRHLRSLLSELKIMMYIGKHPYIIEMVGAITKNLQDGKLFVAFEFCSNGNLQSYLRLCRPIFHDQIIDDQIKVFETMKISKKARRFVSIENAITSAIDKRRTNYGRNSSLPEPTLMKTTTLITWCFQIASGMDFLASKKVVHGDLATRNILITDSLSVKITDFGLSRYMYDYSNYVTKEKSDPVPWRWLSIEAIQDSKFSIQSDVWAYGITLWEIFSLGETPYQSFYWGEEFVQDLCRGYRMGKPQYATTDIHNTMLECWNKAPVDRPSFEDISNYFKELLDRFGVCTD